MKKRYVIFACLTVTYSHAQFYAGQQGINIKSGTDVSFEKLSLRPSSNLTIAENTLRKSETAVPGKPTGSINRVFRFGTAIDFSGTASISYLTSELNGNAESDLQILYSEDYGIEIPDFTVTTGSTVDQAAHRVSNVLSNISLTVLSASGPIRPMDSGAQFYAGKNGITILSGTEVSIENLSLRPSSNLTIAKNTLKKNETALPGNPFGSINRVYRFGTAINFSGTTSISYLASELNGNVESDLQILYSPNSMVGNQGLTITTGSTVDQAAHRVSNVLSNKNLAIVSASGPIRPLPVTLVRFNVISEGRTAVLNWSTSEEIDTDKFVVERSLDARNWTPIGVKDAIGASRTLQNYSYTDPNVTEGINYYRLNMIDRATDRKDESFAYSQIRSLLFSGQDLPFVFPNPVVDKLYLKNVPDKDPVTISVYEISGRLLMEGLINAGEGVGIKDLAPGIYLLKTAQKDGRQSTHTFIKR